METEFEAFDSFDKLNLKDNLLRGIYLYGFERPSRIQQQAIPIIITGKDVIAQAHSGTGKTGTFVVSVLQRINDNLAGCQAIILAHTRELAEQIYQVSKNIGNYLKVKSVLCVGGQDIQKTRNELLEDICTIVIGTPGRVVDLINKQYLNTRLIKILIIDEADEMLSFSFQPQIKTMFENLPNNSQVCIFSATLPNDVLQITSNFMSNPEKILVAKENLTLDGIKQYYINVQKDCYKFETFCDLFSMLSANQTIVYVNSIKRGEYLKNKLEEKNFTVSLIHSSMPALDRIDVMKNFRSGSTRILVSTDLLSRGIDVQQISFVVNYDFPKNKEPYIHRIGRSGRYGRKGVAINLINSYEERQLAELAKYYKTEINPLPEDIDKLI